MAVSSHCIRTRTFGSFSHCVGSSRPFPPISSIFVLLFLATPSLPAVAGRNAPPWPESIAGGFTSGIACSILNREMPSRLRLDQFHRALAQADRVIMAKRDEIPAGRERRLRRDRPSGRGVGVSFAPGLRRRASSSGQPLHARPLSSAHVLFPVDRTHAGAACRSSTIRSGASGL